MKTSKVCQKLEVLEAQRCLRDAGGQIFGRKEMAKPSGLDSTAGSGRDITTSGLQGRTGSRNTTAEGDSSLFKSLLSLTNKSGRGKYACVYRNRRW